MLPVAEHHPVPWSVERKRIVVDANGAIVVIVAAPRPMTGVRTPGIRKAAEDVAQRIVDAVNAKEMKGA